MSKDVYILGLNLSHNATAALLKNGEIIDCIGEERLTRTKNYLGYPNLAIQYVMEKNGIKGSDLTCVALNFKSAILYMLEQSGEDIKSFYDLACKATYRMKILDYLYTKLYGVYKTTVNRSWYRSQVARISNNLKIDPSRIISYDHHVAHAASVVYALGLQGKRLLVLTNDGAGDDVCASVNIYENHVLNEVATVRNAHSLAGLYGNITRYLGMEMVSDEYKVMGLAPYAKPNQRGVLETSKVLTNMFHVEGLQIVSKVDSKHFLLYLDEKLRRKRFDMVALAGQRLIEDVLSEWVRNAINYTGIHEVACAGGIFMNVKANKILSELNELEQFYVMPSSSDESTAIGAAYVAYVDYCRANAVPIEVAPLRDVYLGNSVTNDEIRTYIDENELTTEFFVSFHDDPEGEVARLLANGNVVARYSGRMEFGQRALGNRSILANPSLPHAVKDINERIKSRDFWMPFAGSILAEDQDAYIHNPKKIDAPHMMICFDSTERAQSEIFSALHPYDHTIRPQVVERTVNRKYHELISKFKQLTGIGAVLNTSFNLHGEPIVCSIGDAVHTLRDSGLEYLQIENFILAKWGAKSNGVHQGSLVREPVVPLPASSSCEDITQDRARK